MKRYLLVAAICGLIANFAQSFPSITKARTNTDLYPVLLELESSGHGPDDISLQIVQKVSQEVMWEGSFHVVTTVDTTFYLPLGNYYLRWISGGAKVLNPEITGAVGQWMSSGQTIQLEFIVTVPPPPPAGYPVSLHLETAGYGPDGIGLQIVEKASSDLLWEGYYNVVTTVDTIFYLPAGHYYLRWVMGGAKVLNPEITGGIGKWLSYDGVNVQREFIVFSESPFDVNLTTSVNEVLCGDSVEITASVTDYPVLLHIFTGNPDNFRFQIVTNWSEEVLFEGTIPVADSKDTIFFMQPGNYYLRWLPGMTTNTISGAMGSATMNGDWVQQEFSVWEYFSNINPFSFEWNGGLAGSSSAKWVSPTESGFVRVRVTFDDSGRAVEDSIYVQVNSLTVNAGLDKSAACADSVQFDLPQVNYLGDIEYNWLPADGLSDPTAANPKVRVATSRMYFLQILTSNGCSAVDSVFTTALNALTVDLIDSLHITCGEEVTFPEAGINFGTIDSLTFSWTPSADLNNADLLEPTAYPAFTTTYFLKVSTPSGCFGVDSLMVVVNPFTVSTQPAVELVCGESIQFEEPLTNYTGVEALAYAWSPSEALNHADISQPVTNSNVSRYYTLTAFTSNGCYAMDSVYVSVNPLVLDAHQVAGHCGTIAQFNVVANLSDSLLAYTWTPSVGLSHDTIANPTTTLFAGKKYTVDVVTANGCTASDTLTTEVLPALLNPSICMVTVSGDDMNIVHWQPQLLVDSVYILKELAIAGEFERLSTAHINDSLFIDMFSNASVQANRYQISYRDVCGFESGVSEAHKTVHLTINEGANGVWNLIWEPYVGGEPLSYQILRGTDEDSLVLVTAIAASSTTYTDENAPEDENIYYQIEVIAEGTCSSGPLPGLTGPRSNRVQVSKNITGLEKEPLQESRFFPNPVRDIVRFTKSFSSVIIIDALGKEIIRHENGRNNELLNLEGLPAGVYLISIDGINQKLVKE